MNDIFISYARDDRPTAMKLAHVLETQGWSVWWDRYMPLGKNFRKVITEELSSAQSVIVLWSKQSIESDFVQDEADKGLERGILIPVRIEKVVPPLGFGVRHYANLFDWDGTSTFPACQELITSVARVLVRGKPSANAGQSVALNNDPRGIASSPLEIVTKAVRSTLQKPQGHPLTEQDWAALTELDLSFSDMDDAGLARLRRAQRLEHLDLSGNRISDAGLSHLASLRQLRYLDLSNIESISNAGLQHLSPLSELLHLNLSNTPVGAIGLRYLSNLDSLRELLLYGTRISSEDVACLVALSKLTRLDLGNTPIDDTAIRHLERLSQLEYLKLRHTRVSRAGKEQLKRVLSKCRLIG